MGAAGQAEVRKQHASERNIVVCSSSPGGSWGALHYLVTAIWVVLVALWVCALNAQRLYDTFLAPCPGPVLEPEPRHTPWCIAFARELAREVQVADAGSVRPLGCLLGVL